MSEGNLDELEKFFEVAIDSWLIENGEFKNGRLNFWLRFKSGFGNGTNNFRIAENFDHEGKNTAFGRADLLGDFFLD